MRSSILRGQPSDLKELRLDFEPLGQALELLQSAGASVGQEVMPIAAEILVSAIHEVFEREGAVAGKPAWQDLAPSTKLARTRKGRKAAVKAGLKGVRGKGRKGKAAALAAELAKAAAIGHLPILRDKGILAGSITPFAEGFVAEAFSNVPYAGYHVSQRPRKKIPLRDFTDIDFEAAQREFADLILQQLESNFLGGMGGRAA